MRKLFLILALMFSFNAFAYEFNIGEREFSYNPDTLKFYESSITLSADELKALFPDYEIVLISKFDKEKVIRQLTAEMRDAAKILEFEHAAYLRDKIEKLKSMM